MDKWVKRWYVQGSAREPYVIGQDAAGEYACSCPAWTRHFPRRNCKHIDIVLSGQAMTLEQYTMKRLRGERV